MLTELFRALSSHDLNASKREAERICDFEEKLGHIKISSTLRGALFASENGVSKKNEYDNFYINASEPEIELGLLQLTNKIGLKEVTLRTQARKQVDSVILEWHKKSLLEKHGMPPRSKLIFHGPPGCGKTMTAVAMATELDIPIHMVRFDSLIGSYLGQTASKLRQVFRFAETNPCVLLIDEIDALGKRRGNARDIGELDRIVISLFQELEHSKPIGLVIATTNVPNELDEALWRRFDLNIEFKSPTQKMLSEFAKKIAFEKKIIVSSAVIARAAKTGNFDLCEKVIFDEIRRRIVIEETKA